MTIILGQKDIQNGRVVNLAYILTDPSGQVLDVAKPENPFAYLHGGEMIVPGLEKALTGLKVGDKRQVTVAPEEGYGVEDPDLVMQVPRTQFPKDAELELGMQFEATSPEGYAIVFTIQEIGEEEVTVNGNHPMAGKTLQFQVEVMGVRDATEEEKTHGHPHGPGGHHH